MEAGKRTVRDIFNRGRNLEIPFFQRAYVWEEPQWERFLEDMRLVTDTRRPYFLGSVILKQQDTESDRDSLLTVIDGQQRLTTLNIFMKVLCLKRGEDGDFTEIFKKQRDKSIILLHNFNDEAAFNEVVRLKALTPFEGVSDSDHIRRAFNYFLREITDADVEGTLNFYDIVDNLLFVGIDLARDEDEQQIFDTINSLGVRLTTAELLKNYFFNRDERAAYIEHWRDVFETDDETKRYWDREVTTGRLRRTFIDLFFNAYLQIKIQDPNVHVRTEDKLEFARLNNLFESYKRMVSKYHMDKAEMLAEIKEYAQLFRAHFDYDVVNRALTGESGIERIVAIIFGLETSTVIPYVLYLLKHSPAGAERNELFGLLETYLMRRMVAKRNSKDYNKLFTDRLVGAQVTTPAAFREFLEDIRNSHNAQPNDADLWRGFEHSVIVNKQTRGIIYLLESAMRDERRHATQLLGLHHYSLEHLMPKKWKNNWPGPGNAADEDERRTKLKTLGNLAIIPQTLNTSIRDANWPTKKEGQGNRHGLRHYASGLETLSPYMDLPHWDEKTIVDRAEDLYGVALTVWAYAGVGVES